MEKQRAEKISNYYQKLIGENIKQIHTPYFVLVEKIFPLRLVDTTNGKPVEDYQVFYSGIHQVGNKPIIDSLSSLLGVLAE